MTADELARHLYRSLHDELLTLPDDTLVYPAHGAGSACGKHLSTDTVSTIGEQRRTNYALAPMSEDAFVDVVTQGQAAAPMYFPFAAQRNMQARDVLNEQEPLPLLDLEQVLAARAAGAAVIDTRDAADFASGHLIGSINVGLGGRFAEYTGLVVAPGTPIVLVTEPGFEDEARIRLARIGFDEVVGALATPIAVFTAHPELVQRASRLSGAQLRDRIESLDALQIVDVRGPSEVDAGVVDGSLHVQLPELVARLDELDPLVPTVVYCAGGYRSSIGASTLRAHGFSDVSDLLGGYPAWKSLGVRIATVTPTEALQLDDAVLVDVREADEFAAGHAPGAVHIALGALADHVDELDRDRTIVCVCRSGNRSLHAAQLLADHGLDVRNLEGGMRAWVAAELEIVDERGRTGVVI